MWSSECQPGPARLQLARLSELRLTDCYSQTLPLSVLTVSEPDSDAQRVVSLVTGPVQALDLCVTSPSAAADSDYRGAAATAPCQGVYL